MASAFPWLTLRGLHTDRLKGFSADHWLTFRGLPAECLRVLPHEAASFPPRHVGTSGVLDRRPPQGGLSSAGRRDSSPMDGLLVAVVASHCTRPGSRNTASDSMAGDLFGKVPEAPHATQSGRSPRREAARGPRRVCETHFRVHMPAFFVGGILDAGTWIWSWSPATFIILKN